MEDTEHKGNKHQTAKTHCPQGHEYTEKNTKLIPSTKPGFFKRQCRTCKSDAAKAAAKLKREAKERGPLDAVIEAAQV
jgi:hypothetical protein